LNAVLLYRALDLSMLLVTIDVYSRRADELAIDPDLKVNVGEQRVILAMIRK
jgi:hypothetical protein